MKLNCFSAGTNGRLYITRNTLGFHWRHSVKSNKRGQLLTFHLSFARPIKYK